MYIQKIIFISTKTIFDLDLTWSIICNMIIFNFTLQCDNLYNIIFCKQFSSLSR